MDGRSAGTDGAELPSSYDDNAEALADSFDPGSRRSLATGHASFSWRWLGASVLLGLVGAGLLASSLYVSEGDGAVAQSPEKVPLASARSPAAGQSSRKADLLVQHGFSIGMARHFRAPITESVGQREITKVHALVQVSAELSPLPAANLDIPDFDPAGILAGAEREAQPQSATDPADADVSVVRRDLTGLSIVADARGLSEAAVEDQIAELMRLSGGARQLPPDYSNQRMLSRTLHMAGTAEPEAPPNAAGRFGSLDVRIVPENVTDIPMSSGAQDTFEDRDVVLGHGETLAGVLKANGATDERAAAIVAALGRRARADLPDGQHLRLLIAPEGRERTIQRVTLFDEKGPQEIAAADDRGRFVAVAKTDSRRERAQDDDETDDGDDGSGDRATIYQSAYSSALKSNVPRDVIDDFVRVFAAGMDLKQRAAIGDRLDMIFTEDEATPTGHRELLYAALTAGGETQRVYRYVSPQTGDLAYLDEEGVSLNKLLMRRPVQNGRISSPFGMRRHPILGYARLHSGVDWASPRGTPIMAAGEGTVVAAGVHAGYGNRVELEHANGYASAYNHMASIGKQIKPGAHVRMGEIIGYVGTTGLSTGPHVHYEVTINGHFVDPMKVKLPSSHALAGAALAEFKDHRRQIDALRQQGTAPTVTVQNGHSG